MDVNEEEKRSIATAAACDGAQCNWPIVHMTVKLAIKSSYITAVESIAGPMESQQQQQLGCDSYVYACNACRL